ncbi:MAG TPA: PIG-L family deacetylase [Terriglobia bacterium]|nr:PIG-L family deacetylase [Terriglobia bacterium]
MRFVRFILIFSALFLSVPFARGFALTVHGAPADTGFNAGSPAVIRATISGAAGGQYAVFAELKYAGSSETNRIELRPAAGDGSYEGAWQIPADAPTGLYEVELRVDDAASQRTIALLKAPGFFVYRKLLRITRVSLDKTFYAPGEPIRCEIGIENLTGQPLKGLRIEFSNENYPWISTFSGQENAAGRMAVNPALGLVALRESLDIAAHGEASLPMEPAGKAAFLQGSQVAIMGAGGPARHQAVPPPETDRYTIAVWDHDRKNLLDMQFSPQVIVRDPGRVLPKPYSRNFTHPYNSEIDFKKYREFYPPGYISPVLSLDRFRTMYRPGDRVNVIGSLAPPGTGVFHVEIHNGAGKLVASRDERDVELEMSGALRLDDVWSIPADADPGYYTLTVSERDKTGKDVATAKMELAVNPLPASLMVFCPHEDDEHPFAGLMRAMVEAGLPVHVVFYTGGDVGECERYFDGHPCDPVRAREFGTVRMEESTEALEHLDVQRSQVSFLGLPDGGSGEIWFNHIQPANPFLDIYMAVEHSPYEGMFVPNLPYSRDSVEDAVERLITQFHPAMIAVPHPDERHVDHRTADWFTLKACQELLRRHQIDPATVVLADQAYGSGGYKPAPYHYRPYVLRLSGEVAALKQEMGWIYQSQDGNLDEGSKKTFIELPRSELHEQILDWQQHEGWNE